MLQVDGDKQSFVRILDDGETFVNNSITTNDEILELVSCFISGGKIQESGTHEELLALGGYYHDLYEHQFREERLHSAMKDAGME